MEDYIIQHWEGAGLLVFAFVSLLRAWWQRRSEAEHLKVEKRQTDNQTVDILSKSLQAALSSVTAQQGQIEIIQADRVKLTERLITQQNQVDRLEDDLRRHRAESETVNAQMGAELVKVRGELATAKTQIRNLEQQLESRDIKIREQDQKIVMLNSENERLKCEVELLRTSINTKQDKPKTDEIEPGETAPDIPETKECN